MKQLFYSPIAPEIIKKERQKARELRQSQWWKLKVSQGVCHFCEKKFSPNELTMDHLLPLGRGGKSTRGNVVPACKACNSEKAHRTPVEQILESLSQN